MRRAVFCKAALTGLRSGAFGFFRKPAPQEGEDGSFFRFQALDVAAQFAFGFCFQLKHELAVHVGIQNFRMHVAFAADGRRIAKFARDLFNRGSKISLRLRGAVKALKLIEGHSREDRARPGAKVLRGDILAGDFLVDALSGRQLLPTVQVPNLPRS
jgi:hypothetical protein